MQKKFAILFLSFFSLVMTYAQSGKTDQLNVPGPIVINKSTFNLAWSSHPSPVYYKQEYITAGDKVEKFKKMVLVEALIGDSKPADLVNAKIAELKQMKLSNPIVNYETFQKNGEYILDFLVSENSADGKKINILERNVYRYKAITDKNGKKAVMLFGASERAYGNEVDGFLSALKTNKSALQNAVAAFTVPQVTFK
jgi:hypothetical protein